MKKRLRLLAWMLTLTMLCELLPFGAFAQSDVGQQLAFAAAQSLEEENGEATIIGKCGDNLQWSLSSDGVLTIDGTGEMYDFTAASSSHSLSPWSNYADKITSVIMHYGVTHVGNTAFFNCTNLSSVTIPESVTSIGSSVFQGCTSLTSIILPDSVTTIGEHTFASCTALSSIILPKFLTSISPYLFASCPIESITLPSSITSIEKSAFQSCSSLTSITIPDSVTSISSNAFFNCSILNSITIPTSVISIGSFAFDNCFYLRDVYYTGTQDQWNAISIGYYNDDLTNATIHYQSTDTGNEPSPSQKCGDNLTWSLSSDGVLTIDGTGEMYDFSLSYNPWSDYTDSIKTVIVNYGVTHIGNYAFNRCTNLYSATLPESVTSIGRNAFYRCTSLTSIILPESVSSIGEATFRGCKALTSVNIPASITSIENSTFESCESLATINIPESVTSIGIYAFGSCASLNSIDIPESVTSIGYGAFSRCTSLTSITIPKSITSIETYTFNNCTSLASIYIPESVNSINKEAFFECTSLSDVYYSGTKNQWNAISIDSGNDPLLNATIHYQSTGPEDEKVFTFGRDNFSFLNTPKYFFKGDELNYYYTHQSAISGFTSLPSQYGSIHISKEKMDVLTRNLSPSAANWIKSVTYSGDPWPGSCYGMVLVSVIHYMNYHRLPYNYLKTTGLDSDSPSYALPAPVDNAEVEDLINYYLLTQLLPSHYKVWSNCLYNCAHDFDNVLNEIISSLSQGIPVIASLPAHEIMLLNVKETHPEYYKLGFYDPLEETEQTLILYREPYIDSDGDGYLKIQYNNSDTHIKSYMLASDLDIIDVRNPLLPLDYETATDYNDGHIFVSVEGMTRIIHGNQYFYRAENGKLIEKDSSVRVLYPTGYLDDGSSPSTVELVFPKPSSSEDFRVELSSDETNNASLLLNDTLLSISTSGPVELTYNEADRTVDVTAENPTDVNLLMTKNDVNESWPWHSWALDTTGTTTLHADLDDDGLHLSGDGITNAKYATENADTENVDSGTISVQPDADGITTVTITNKKSSSGDTLEIVTPSAPTTGNAIAITNGFAYIDDPEQPVNSAALGDVVTIVANDRSSESKTFTGWVVNSGNVTLDDSSASPTSFTMGDKAVSITAQYSTNSTPTPTPGGGSSSGGGGGGGGGAAVLIGVGAAAAITAGVIMMSPVDVKGRVVLADQAAVPGAKISLLREGKVVAQTTADENGNFALKAKRGSYELTAAYTTADGQLIYKTIDIKAPAKDLTVTF